MDRRLSDKNISVGIKSWIYREYGGYYHEQDQRQIANVRSVPLLAVLRGRQFVCLNENRHDRSHDAEQTENDRLEYGGSDIFIVSCNDVGDKLTHRHQQHDQYS